MRGPDGFSAATGEDALRRRARDAIAAGRLPACAPTRIWGGQSDGSICALCEEVVASGSIDFEIEFGADGARAPESRHFHVPCFRAWDAERQERPTAPAASAAAALVLTASSSSDASQALHRGVSSSTFAGRAFGRTYRNRLEPGDEGDPG